MTRAVILEEALADPPPLMVSHPRLRGRPGAPPRVLEAHRLLDLQLYGRPGCRTKAGPRRAGRSGGAGVPAGGSAEAFSVQRQDGSLALQGLVRLNSEASCQECHPAPTCSGRPRCGSTSPARWGAAQSRVGRHLGLLIVAGPALVVLTNVIATRFAKRSWRS